MLLDIAVQYFAQSAEIGHSIGCFASVLYLSMHAHAVRLKHASLVNYKPCLVTQCHMILIQSKSTSFISSRLVLLCVASSYSSRAAIMTPIAIDFCFSAKCPTDGA